MLFINQNELLLGRKHCHFNSFICNVEIATASKSRQHLTLQANLRSVVFVFLSNVFPCETKNDSRSVFNFWFHCSYWIILFLYSWTLMCSDSWMKECRNVKWIMNHGTYNKRLCSQLFVVHFGIGEHLILRTIFPVSIEDLYTHQSIEEIKIRWVHSIRNFLFDNSLIR
jgi:hypothetical protein